MPASLPIRAIAAALTMAALPAAAQQASAPSQAPAPADPFAGLPAPKAEDVSSVEGILAALYGSISGEVGQKRDWDRFRSLFYPGAKLMPAGTPKGSDVARTRSLAPDEYARGSGPFLERIGFHEVEIARRIERYGHVAHVFSTYEGHSTSTEIPPVIRGINSIQLFNDGKRWWVINIFWMQETEAFPIPKEYLPG